MTSTNVRTTCNIILSNYLQCVQFENMFDCFDIMQNRERERERERENTCTRICVFTEFLNEKVRNKRNFKLIISVL